MGNNFFLKFSESSIKGLMWNSCVIFNFIRCSTEQQPYKKKKKQLNKLEINMHHLRGTMQYRQAPWAIFFYKIKRGGGCLRSVASRHSRQTSRLWLLKCWLTGAEIAKIGIFLYKVAQKGYTPFSNLFYKIWLGGRSPRTVPSYQISLFWLSKMWAYGPPNRKILWVHRKSWI